MATNLRSELPFWKNKKKIGVHLIFWPIILVFVIWGFERYGNPTGGAAAVVNDHAISLTEFRGALRRMVDMYQQITQGHFDEEAEQRYHVRQSVMQQLINAELISQGASQMGLQVTDQELADTISQIPALKKDGKFSKDVYRTILANNNLSPGQFEAGLRKDTLIEKTRNLFDKDILVNPLEVDKLQNLKSQRANLEYMTVSAEDLKGKISVSEGEIKDFTKQADSTSKIKEYYDLHHSEFSQNEQVKASHILIKAKRGDAKEESAAKAKMIEVRKQLTASNFSQLAKKYSDDPGSKAKGGDLGWFEKGRMVPEFDKVVFTMKPGQVSDVIQTDFGYHIIKLEDKKTAHETTLTAATPLISKKLVEEKKQTDLIASLENKISQNPQDAVLLAQKSGGKWQETGAFALSEDAIPKIGSDDDLSKDVGTLAPGQVAKHLYKVGNHYFIVKLKSIQKDESKKTDVSLDPSLKSRPREVFAAWSSKLSEKAKISVNNQLFGEGAADMPAPSGDF